ncbi:MAG TPA: cobalt-precorrin-7 (C(5))-methyltransferase [Fibrobacteraceae bacterium]|nr:cobalt-precorrin-7 (C(5))-methyltransferase [Fibrobacteraceae bacterium]
MEIKPGRLYLLGCGPGHTDYVTPLVRQIANNAQWLIGSPRMLELFPKSPAKRLVHERNLPELLAQVKIFLSANQTVAWLCTGDSGFYSVARVALKTLGHSACICVSGISSVQVACARLGLDWSCVRMVSAHGRTPDIPILDARTALAVLAGSLEQFPFLLESARMWQPTHRLYACADLTLDTEVIQEIVPEEIEDWVSHPRVIFLWVPREEIYA